MCLVNTVHVKFPWYPAIRLRYANHFQYTCSRVILQVMLPTRHISELQNDRVHHSYHSVYQKWTSVQIILAYGRVECFHLITTMYFHGVWLMASIFHTRKIDCPTGLISITEYTCITGVSNAPQKKWMRSFHMCNQFVLVSF